MRTPDKIPPKINDDGDKPLCHHCYCRKPKTWMGVGPAPSKCCKCGDEMVSTHGKEY